MRDELKFFIADAMLAQAEIRRLQATHRQLAVQATADLQKLTASFAASIKPIRASQHFYQLLCKRQRSTQR